MAGIDGNSLCIIPFACVDINHSFCLYLAVPKLPLIKVNEIYIYENVYLVPMIT